MDAATKETYEKIKVGCNFDKVINNIKNFVKLKKKYKSPLPDICFRYIITTMNLQEIPKFVELVASLGGKQLSKTVRIEFTGLLEFEEIKHLKVHELPKETVQAAVEKMKKYDIPIIFAHSEEKKLPSINSCLAWMEPYIMIDGDVVPCCAILMSNKRTFLREHAFGNVYEKSFKEIWYSERYIKFRNTVNKHNAKVPLLCKGCRAYNTNERIEKYGIDEEL
jgi:radical SAM protein with 4Fe4S-binding SPASM domain